MKPIIYTIIFLALTLFSCKKKDSKVQEQVIIPTNGKNIKYSNRIGKYILPIIDNWEYKNFDSIAYLIKENDTVFIRTSKDLNWGFKSSVYQFINENNLLSKKNTSMITYFENLKSKFFRHKIAYKETNNQKRYYATPITPQNGYTELHIYDKLNHDNLSVSAKNLSIKSQEQVIAFFEKIRYKPLEIHLVALNQNCNEYFDFLPQSYGSEKIIDTKYTQDTLVIKYAYVSACGNSFSFSIKNTNDTNSIILNKTLAKTYYTKATISNYKVVKQEQMDVSMSLECLCENIIQIKIAGLKSKMNYKIKIN